MKSKHQFLTRSTPEGARELFSSFAYPPWSVLCFASISSTIQAIIDDGGMDKNYQIVRCFRDEDLRADRQPEFTQLDIETSFLDENEIKRYLRK